VAIFLGALILLLLLAPKESTVEHVDQGKVYVLCGVLTPLKKLRQGCIYEFEDITGKMKAVAFFGGCISGYACITARADTYRGERELVILEYR